ncbi:sulfite exporter TauE/SafE family protein [uncultured Mitsuokella sp.]|uniref:sulfite exporter TauE/SafE family protein n=1 Tax=uncultured Mitsuokella sp. TaxID=453120 RepID=UPI0026131BC5|nr:sulfite exporter TauE/SafE family protein [uncultured Mitsuokella sp.]
MQTFLVWKDARYKLIGAILVGYIVAQPFGFWIFAHFSANQLKLLVSTVILVSLLLMQFTHHEFSLCRRNSILIGILAGLCGVTTGMAGPPLILYFAYTKMTPAELRGTSVVFFLFQGVSMYSAAVESIYLIPALVIGLLLGHAVIRFVSVKLFCFLIFFMLYFICAYMFYELAVQ